MSTNRAAADIRVRGARDAYEIAAVIALLGREPGRPPVPTGVTAWQRTRRAALTPRTAHRPTRREPRP